MNPETLEWLKREAHGWHKSDAEGEPFRDILKALRTLTRERDEARATIQENQEELAEAARDWQEMRESFRRAAAEAAQLKEGMAEIANRLDAVRAKYAIERGALESVTRERDEARAAQTKSDQLTERVIKERDEARTNRDDVRKVERDTMRLRARLGKVEALNAELLAALKQQSVDTPGPNSRPCWCSNDDCVCRDSSWCVRTRAAIAKAEGKS